MKRLLVALALCGCSCAALAQSAGREACAPDTKKFCSSATGAQTQECLVDHQKEITDACYDFLKATYHKPQAASASQAANTSQPASASNAPTGGAVCQTDVPKFCKGISPGNGRIKDCLIDHQKEISDACYGYLSKQISGNAINDGELAGIPSYSSTAIYRSRQADGRIVYSDAPVSNAVIERQVQFLNSNLALPQR